MYKRQSEDCQEYYFDFEAYASHLQEHGKFLVTEHGLSLIHISTVVTALPTTPVHAESKQYWTEAKERVGIVEKVMNDGSIGSTFNERCV